MFLNKAFNVEAVFSHLENICAPNKFPTKTITKAYWKKIIEKIKFNYCKKPNENYEITSFFY